MTIAYDAKSETTGTTDPTTHTHTPVGTPKGVWVFISHPGSTDIVDLAGVTYGGVALDRSDTAVDTTGSPGRSYSYFLGTGIPTGAQTVSVGRTEATTTIHVVCTTMTGSTDTEIVDTAKLEDNTTNPQVTLAYDGRSCLGLCGMYSGRNELALVTDLGTMTRLHDHLYASNLESSYASRQTTVGTSDFTIGYTCGSDSVAFVALAVSEAADDPTELPVTGTGSASAPRSPAFLRAAIQAAKSLPVLVKVLSIELPRFAQSVTCYERSVALPYGTTVRPSGHLTRVETITVDDTEAFTIANPTEPREGVELTFDIYNDSGGTMGALTWAGEYELTAAFTNPEDGKHRLISFMRMSDGVWRESRRSANDLD